MRTQKFAKKLLSIVLIGALVGCLSEIRSAAQTAQDILTSASAIISPKQHDLGAKLAEAAGDFGLLDKIVAEVETAKDPTQKQSLALQASAIGDTLTAHLTEILNAAHVKNDELTEYIEEAVAIGNSVLKEVIRHLPQAGVHAQAATVSACDALPSIPFKSHKDLKDAWNKKVAASFPNAKI